MNVSVIIPLWNGAAVISDCLQALHRHSAKDLTEIICVDNASQDESAQIVADRFPPVTLLRQPVNLGFAGGVNVGLDAARGDLLVLLNQDCLVEAGWLPPLQAALAEYPAAGIAGGAIYSADDSLDHAGAEIERPLAYGRHLTDLGPDDRPRPVEYVTGALYALTRQTWQQVGRFDDDFYPAYYEESDYCYRAHRHGLETLVVPQARATHLFSSREWQTDPTRHTANQHHARYRFVSKHFSAQELSAFFAAETEALERETYFDQAVGRMLGARDLLRRLPALPARLQTELGVSLTPAEQRQRYVGFVALSRRALAVARRLISPQGGQPRDSVPDRLAPLRERQHHLLDRIYFTAGDEQPETTAQRLFRLLVRRPLSFITGREYLLQSELNATHVIRMNQMDRLFHELDSRLSLLEVLTDYDYR